MGATNPTYLLLRPTAMDLYGATPSTTPAQVKTETPRNGLGNPSATVKR